MEGGARSTVMIWVVAAVLAAVAGFRLLGGHDAPAAPVRIDGGPGATLRGSGPAAGGAGAKAAGVYVHVAGAVRRPGLIRVPADTRVATALERAGGPTRRADLTLVNLAAKVQDGQQILVPGRGAAPAGAGAAAGGVAGVAGGTGVAGVAGGAGPKIHLSTATVEQLDQIDGIGPELAGRIVEYRDAHAGFRSLNELSEVDGIGEKRLATLRDALQP